MTSKQHLHPIALVPFFYRTIHDWLVPIIGAVWGLINLYASKPLLFQILTIAVIILVLGLPLTRYLTFTYQLTDQAITVRYGLFFKHRNHVPYDRIQNITVNQWFFLKPFNVVELMIETAGHSEGSAEVSLTAVPSQLAATLEKARQQRSTGKSSANVETVATTTLPTENSYQINNQHLWAFAATSPAFLTALLAIAAFYGRIERNIPRSFYTLLFQSVGHVGLLLIVGFVLFTVLIVYLGSALVIISQYYRFRLTLLDHQLVTERGFFQKKTVTLPITRIQAVRIQQPLLRGWLEMATIQLVIVSNSKKDDAAKNLVIMPLIPVSQIEPFLHQFLPALPSTWHTATLFSPRTRFYNLRNALLISLLVLIPIIWFSHQWPVISIITAIALGLLILYPAELQSRRSQIQTVDENYVWLQRNHLFTRDQYLIKRPNIQSAELSQSKWLISKHLGKLTLRIRSGNGQTALTVRYLPIQALNAVLHWYRRT